MANDHYSRAQELICTAGLRIADARGPSATQALLEALALATLANTHAQLASAEPRELEPTDPGDAYDQRWCSGDDEPNEPDDQINTLVYHSSTGHPAVSYLHRQERGGWAWSTRPASAGRPDHRGMPWELVTADLPGYFTEFVSSRR
jgi:hypothetical protein